MKYLVFFHQSTNCLVFTLKNALSCSLNFETDESLMHKVSRVFLEKCCVHSLLKPKKKKTSLMHKVSRVVLWRNAAVDTRSISCCSEKMLCSLKFFETKPYLKRCCYSNTSVSFYVTLLLFFRLTGT